MITKVSEIFNRVACQKSIKDFLKSRDVKRIFLDGVCMIWQEYTALLPQSQSQAHSPYLYILSCIIHFEQTLLVLLLLTRSTSWHFFNASPHFSSLWYAKAHSVWNHIHCISFKFSIAETPSYKTKQKKISGLIMQNENITPSAISMPNLMKKSVNNYMHNLN